MAHSSCGGEGDADMGECVGKHKQNKFNISKPRDEDVGCVGTVT